MKRTVYVKADGQQTPDSTIADHREEMVYRDSVGGRVRIYYPSGKLRRVVPYLHFARGIKYGVESSFYETGEAKSRCEHLATGPAREYVQLYRNGNVRLRLPLDARFDRGGKAVGETFMPDGITPRPESAADKMPVFKGGNEELLRAVQRRAQYPAEALRAQVTGKVVVSFMVDDAGFVRDVQIVETPSPLFNATVLRAVAALGRLTPGEMDGEPVDVFYTVPITFAMR